MLSLITTAFLGAVSMSLGLSPLGWFASLAGIPLGGSLGAGIWAFIVVTTPDEVASSPTPPGTSGAVAEDA